MHNIVQVKKYLLELQKSICQELANEDGEASFVADKWHNRELGYGTSCVIANGAVFEKGGVNFSHVMVRPLACKQEDVSNPFSCHYPPKASWIYDWQPDPGTEEEQLHTQFLVNKNWIELNTLNKED